MSAEERGRSPRAPGQNKRALFLVGVVGALALLAETAALTGLFPAWPSSTPIPPTRAEDLWRHYRRPPLQPEGPPPPAWPAATADLSDDAKVIGVSAGGKHRAYLVSALATGPAHHIVNDLVGGKPLSVAYCNIHDCVQVVTGEGDLPLKLQVGGLESKSMLVAVGEHLYRQSTLEAMEAGAPSFPYRRHVWERTTWGAWKKAHPGTDVFLGRGSGPAPTKPPPSRASS
jgi:hypothetical protein